ncbi:MAG: 4Fe-4S dicluster domain-containing protein [Calditrichia bacterium]
MSYGVLFDTTLCVGCESCMYACQEAHGQPENDTYKLRHNSFTVVNSRSINEEDIYFRKMCMHCQDPSCASVCPVGAFQKTKEGPVIYKSDRCMGCRYCMVACPFDVPKYEWAEKLPYVRKCDMCYDRVKKGLPTVCSENCPTGATLFGERDKLIDIARDRIKQEPHKYHPYVYGVKEAGGTSVLFLSSVSLDQLGFKTKDMQKAFPKFTWEVMKEIPNVVTFGGVFMYGLWWIINRRIEVQKMYAGDNGSEGKEDRK